MAVGICLGEDGGVFYLARSGAGSAVLFLCSGGACADYVGVVRAGDRGEGLWEGLENGK